MHYSLAAGMVALAAGASATPCPHPPTANPIARIDVGPRPGFLVDDMDDGPLKEELQQCLDSPDPLRASTLSIGHRGGGTLQIPEHSVESNMAGARMGSGVIECDVAFTKDRELVCRHSQCDLHYTTNIVTIPELNAKCTKPFTPADGDAPAEAVCCTSDITLAEFRTLCATMEGFNASATTPEAYVDAPPSWRTDLYSTCGTVMSLQDHIALTASLGLKHSPELKTPEVEMPFEGDYTQEDYAQQLVDEYREAGIPPEDVYLQSFLYDDLLYWLEAEPEWAAQAMFLDSYGETPETFPDAVANLTTYWEDGVRYLAPPIPYLLTSVDGKVVPSEYADRANELGFKMVAWSLERSGRLAEVQENGNYYFMYFADAIDNDGDVYTVVDVMVRDIGIVGLFTDWSGTVTFYANCFGLGLLG